MSYRKKSGKRNRTYKNKKYRGGNMPPYQPNQPPMPAPIPIQNKPESKGMMSQIASFFGFGSSTQQPQSPQTGGKRRRKTKRRY